MNRKLLLGFSFALLLGVGTWRYWSHRPQVTRLQGEFYDQLAQLAGDETSQLLGNRGSVVVVQWDATALGIPRYDDPIAQFRQRIGTHGLKVAAVEIIKLKRGANAPGPRLAEIVRRHAAADALVLFGGAYGLTVRDIANLPAPRPKLISVLAFDVKVRPLFDQQLLALALVERSFMGETKEGDSPFVVLHPADLATLPVNSGLPVD